MKWRKVRLIEISKPKQWKNLPISALTPNGFAVYGANGIIGRYKEYNHEFPTLAITCRGATCGTINITEPKSYITSNAMSLDEISDDVDQMFLYFALNIRGFKDVITGAAQPQITREGLAKIALDIPESKEYQAQIANLLCKAENLINQRKESIRLLDELVKSSFLEMFYSNPEVDNWDEVKFEELADKKKGSMRTGPFGSSLLHGEFTISGDVKVLGIDNVVTNRFDWQRSRCITFEKFQELKRYQVYPNDVLISIMATLGRTAVVPKDIPICINSKHLAAITLKNEIANPYFVAYAFHSHPLIVRQMSNNVKGAIMDGLNLTIIKKIKIKSPPIELQNKFGEMFEKTEALKIQYQQSLKELENLYGSLSQKAFRGELSMEIQLRSLPLTR
jgi:type I restriction enzyme S subunit